MDPPSWTEIIGLLTISLGWAEFFRRISEDRKRNFGGPQAEFRRTASGISEDRKRRKRKRKKRK